MFHIQLKYSPAKGSNECRNANLKKKNKAEMALINFLK